MNDMIDGHTVKPARVISNVEIAKDIYLLELESLHYLHEIPQPFQFFMIWIPRVDEIPLSVADFSENRLRFLYKVKGDGTKTLAKYYNEGMVLGVKGPLGKGINRVRYTSNVKWLAIAGGIGVAPIPYMIKVYRRYGVHVDLLWGVKTSDEVFNIHNLFPGTEGGKVIITTEDCRYENGYCGTVVDAIKHIDLENYDDVIAVGPRDMLKTICLELYKFKLDPYVGLETLVKCGMGICGSCYVKASDKLLCIEGPVFRCSEVLDHLKTNSAIC